MVLSVDADRADEQVSASTWSDLGRCWVFVPLLLTGLALALVLVPPVSLSPGGMPS